MSDEPPPALGHNNPPPEPAFELRRCRVSCDWTSPKRGSPRPRRFQSYWRIYRDGTMIDSFLTKRRASEALRRLQREAGDAL